MRQLLICVVLLTIFASVHAQAPAEEEAAPTLVCPVPSDNPTLGTPSDVAGYASAIENYLSSGGNATSLIATLRERGMLAAQNPTNYPYYGGVWFLDVTGDGYDDAIVNLYYLPENVSALWLFTCEGSVYEKNSEVISHSAPSDSFGSGLYVTYIDDFNGDEQYDIAYHVLSCGMFCSVDVGVLTWDAEEQTLREVLQTHFSLGTEGNYHLEDINADDIAEVIVLDDPIGPADYGDVRERLTTFRWNGRDFIEVGSVLEPARYGFEVVYDAIDLLDRQGTHSAIALYETLLSDPPILPMDDTLRAHALFGLLVANAAQEGIGAAADEYAALVTYAPRVVDATGSHESLWVEYGNLFYQTAQTSGDLHLACSDAIILMNVTAFGARRLEYWGDYGTGNPAPLPEDVCPL